MPGSSKQQHEPTEVGLRLARTHTHTGPKTLTSMLRFQGTSSKKLSGPGQSGHRWSLVPHFPPEIRNLFPLSLSTNPPPASVWATPLNIGLWFPSPRNQRCGGGAPSLICSTILLPLSPRFGPTPAPHGDIHCSGRAADLVRLHICQLHTVKHSDCSHPFACLCADVEHLSRDRSPKTRWACGLHVVSSALTTGNMDSSLRVAML